MSKHRVPGIFGLFGLLLASLVTATVGTTAQAPAPTTGEVTFTRDIAPILQRSCQDCHRPDSVAPMSLLTYEDVRPWARSMKARTALRSQRGAMPPFFVERNIGIQKFKKDPSLSDEQIATIAKWVESGAPRGNLADMPKPLNFDESEKWTIGEPDERVLIHPQALFHVPLCQGARGQVHALCVPAKTRDRGIIQADAQRMAHVVHCNTLHYDSRYQLFACWCAWLLQLRFPVSAESVTSQAATAPGTTDAARLGAPGLLAGVCGPARSRRCAAAAGGRGGCATLAAPRAPGHEPHDDRRSGVSGLIRQVTHLGGDALRDRV